MTTHPFRALSIILVSAIALSACSSSEDNGEQDLESYRNTSQLSRLDKPGLEQIKQTGFARFDARRLPLDGRAIGWTRYHGLGPRVDAKDNYDGGEITIEFLGPAGPFSINASSFTALPISIPEGIRKFTMFRPFDTKQQACDDMLANAQRFGFKLPDIRSWCDQDVPELAGSTAISAGIGDIALPMSVDAKVGENIVMLTYILSLSPGMLTPSERETIRSYPDTEVIEPPLGLGQAEGDSMWTD